MPQNLIIEQRNRIAIVTLNRPELHNAFDDALISSLTAALRQLERDENVRAIVLAGAGTAFCAGADLNWMKRVAGYGFEQNFEDGMGLATLLQTLDRLGKPTLARVHGYCFAGGLGLVAACDIAVGALDAEFCLTEVKLGLSPATISPYVVRAMGERAARRYFLSGERFTAAEAYRLGLLSDLAPPEELDATVNALLGHIVAGGRAAQAKIKDLIRAVAHGTVDDTMVKDTARRLAEVRGSDEAKEGIRSFLEKRKPAWLEPSARKRAGEKHPAPVPPKKPASKKK